MNPADQIRFSIVGAVVKHRLRWLRQHPSRDLGRTVQKREEWRDERRGRGSEGGVEGGSERRRDDG